jgi:hypothetical protein
MRKTLFVSVMVFIFCTSVFSGEKFMISVSGNYLNPSDSGFKDVYGNSVYYPELKVGFKFYGDFYLWVGYGFFSKKGTTTELEQEAKSTQHFFSFGIGHDGKISEKLGYKVELGGFNADYKEEAMGEDVTGSSIGYAVETGILYRVWSSLFIKISAGYLSASDKVEEVEIKLGGFKAGIGVEARF